MLEKFDRIKPLIELQIPETRRQLENRQTALRLRNLQPFRDARELARRPWRLVLLRVR